MCAVFKDILTNPIPIFEALDKYSRPEKINSLISNIDMNDYDAISKVINKSLRVDLIGVMKSYINLIEFEPDLKRQNFIEKKFIKNIENSINSVKKYIPHSFAKSHIIKSFEILIGSIKVRKIHPLETYDFIENSFKLNAKNEIEFKDTVLDLWSCLKRAKLIDSKTKKTQIKKLLTNTPLAEKIIWTGELQQFKYFIDVLVKHPKVEGVKRNKWRVALKCFHVADKQGVIVSNHKISNQKKPTLSKQKKINSYLNF